MQYILHYDICALIILGVVGSFLYFKKQLPTRQTKMYGQLVVVVFCSVVIDLLCAVIQSYQTALSWGLHMAINTLYFALRGLVAFSFARYAFSLTEQVESVKTNKVLFMLPFGTVVLCLVANFWVPVIFTITPEGHYQRGNGIYLLYGAALIYVLLSAVFVSRYRQVISANTRRAVLSFACITLLTAVLQWRFPYLLVEAFGMALCMLLIYMAIQRPEDLLDKDTKLLNDAAMKVLLPAWFAAKKQFFAVTVIVDDYDVIYRTLGAVLTGRIMSAASAFLNTCCVKDTIFRLGDNKFLIIANLLSREQAAVLAERIQQRFGAPWRHGQGQMRLFIKQCILECPKEAKTLDELLDYVDTAQVQKKALTVLCKRDLEYNHRKRINELQRAVNEAIAYNRFEVYYQPIYSVATGKIQSAEALLRLFDPKLGPVSPEEFIPVAEQSGMIVRIGKIVMESVCRFWSRERLRERGLQYLEVNLSVIECMQDNLAGEILSILERHGVRPSEINLEITETAEVYSSEAFQENIFAINRAGLDLSLDDYGTGYSTMSYVVNLPFCMVKIDKSMIWGAFKNQRAATALESAIQMMKKLGLQIVAEGVETPEQVEQLRRWGCEYLQGYYFSKPLPEKEFLSFLDGRGQHVQDPKTASETVLEGARATVSPFF